MSLNLFSKTTKQKPSKFIAVEINQQTVKAAIWQKQSDNQINVLKVSEAIAIEKDTPESILQSLDMAISTIEEGNKLVSKVIFGLDKTWIDQDGIKQDKRKVLKYLCQNLGFEPLGFLATFDSILNFTQKDYLQN